MAATATSLAEHRQRCLEAGMDEVLTKPFSREALEALFKRVAAGIR